MVENRSFDKENKILAKIQNEHIPRDPNAETKWNKE